MLTIINDDRLRAHLRDALILLDAKPFGVSQIREHVELALAYCQPNQNPPREIREKAGRALDRLRQGTL